MRMIAIFVLALSLGILSGAVTSASAVLENYAHSGDCCPAGQSEGQADAAHCVSPECQCLSCLAIDLQQIVGSFIDSAQTKAVYHDAVLPLKSGDYRSIDYPPEAA